MSLPNMMSLPTMNPKSMTTDRATDETTSHPAKQPQDGCQVVGYSHLTNPAAERLLAGHPKDAGQVIGYEPSTGLRTSLRGVLAGLCLLASLPVFAGDFSVRDLQGKTHSLAAHRGQWVLVNFWATWCPPCLSEIPELNSLQAAHKNLVVIGVAIQSGTRAEVADFVGAHQMVYPVVMGSRAITEQVRLAADNSEEIEGLPTSFLFGPKGELVYDQAGEITRKTIERLMQSRKSN